MGPRVLDEPASHSGRLEEETLANVVVAIGGGYDFAIWTLHFDTIVGVLVGVSVVGRRTFVDEGALPALARLLASFLDHG